MMLYRVTLVCFAASYGVALLVELLHLFQPRRVHRLLGTLFGAAGLLAHTLFLARIFFLAPEIPPLSSPYGSLLFLAWIFAIFYLYGSLHHRRVVWGVFVLPLVLAFIGLAALAQPDSGEASALSWWQGEKFWSTLHGVLLLLAGVGICVGFLASVMYLIQAHRLRAKVPPRQGMRLLSLERLEEMIRRAITLAFPLLTAGVLIGMAQMVQHAGEVQNWLDPKVLGTAGLWLVFALLLYLRLGAHLRGRNMALLTIVAFLLLVFTLGATHTVVQGGNP
jgi:ABC-type transport system involved in cytochrome c biogenesis permease subunit